MVGDIPIWGSNGICGFHSEAMYDGPGVMTGRSGTIGEVYYTSEPYWPLNTTLFVKDFHGNNPKYIYYLLNSFDFKKYSAGSAVPTLNRNDVH
ncbi:MAG: restriction endonuclease subunit S, partial [Proteobacteria bacterium]|nr:restriction endonuclease subunit S [Pseudomonadota bacterium]